MLLGGREGHWNAARGHGARYHCQGRYPARQAHDISTRNPSSTAAFPYRLFAQHAQPVPCTTRDRSSSRDAAPQLGTDRDVPALSIHSRPRRGRPIRRTVVLSSSATVVRGWSAHRRSPSPTQGVESRGVRRRGCGAGAFLRQGSSRLDMPIRVFQANERR